VKYVTLISFVKFLFASCKTPISILTHTGPRHFVVLGPIVSTIDRGLCLSLMVYDSARSFDAELVHTGT
jgi:hypothetical protein